MWVFGHLGFGAKLASPLSRKLPFGWLLLGTLLPDLIDKPLYYALYFTTGRHGADLGLISCTRTFGHSSLLILALSLSAYFRRSRVLAAITLGMATHLMLDGFQDYWIYRVLQHEGESSLLLAALYPLYEGRFGVMPYGTMGEHLKAIGDPFLIVTEVLGLSVLGWEIWKKKWPKKGFRSELFSRRSKVGR